MWVPSFKSAAVKEYQRYRKVGKTLNQKIIEAFVDSDVIDYAARMLHLGRNRQLFLDSEDDLDVLMDFALYEIAHQGLNIVQRYQAAPGGQNQVERTLLAAMVRAQTSLFRVESSAPQRGTVSLRSLVGAERTITLTDINFSQTMIPGLVVFLRPIELPECTMTSGIAFVFAPALAPALAQKWERQWARQNTAERYAEIFKLSKRKGYEVMFE